MPIPRINLKNYIVATLKRMVLIERPSLVLIMCANYLMTTYDRELLPDWVEALANINPELLVDGCDEVRRMIIMDETISSEVQKESSRDYHEIEY